MNLSTPQHTMTVLLTARARGDVAMALSCYETNATVVTAPGNVARGQQAIKAFIAATMSLPISFGERTMIEAGDIALNISRWTLRPTDGPEVSGRTTDILRRQMNGDWLLVVDNPWGSALLQQ